MEGKMNISLALICQHNWLSLNMGKNCDPRVIDAFSMHEGEIHLWPTGDQLEEPNRICRGCPDRLFETDGKLCPACGSRELSKKIPGFTISNETKTLAETKYLE
jgi:RNA polymerase subunit RPABC4/transcription elongation factor Spt4